MLESFISKSLMHEVATYNAPKEIFSALNRKGLDWSVLNLVRSSPWRIMISYSRNYLNETRTHNFGMCSLAI